MKKIALIHTVRTGYLDFGREVAAAFPEVEVTNLLDEHLAKEAVESGMSPALADRFLSVAQLAEKTGSDLLVCTCTSMIPVVDVVRPFLSVPMILIDDEMHRCAAALHQHVTVFATAESALKPTVQKYKDQVYRQTGHIPEVSAVVCPEANIYMRTGNMQKHDELVLQSVKAIKNAEVIILAQYSITHLSRQIQAICGGRVLGSGEYCIQEISRILGQKVQSRN